MPPSAPVGSSGPNPALAGILSIFPGVGAVYNGQYAKGLAHLTIFGLLCAGISASDSGHGEALGVLCGLFVSFFYVYQIVDAVRSARAIQAGLPTPDPYGIAATFGAGTAGSKVDTSKVPIGAIVLILLGVLFLLNTMGIQFGLNRFWPVILIVIGFWLFARNWGLWGQETRLAKIARVEGFAAGHGNPAFMQQAMATARCQCPRCRACRIMGPAVLVTLGILLQIESLGGPRFWHNTWPILLLVIGGVKLFQSTASTEGHVAFTPLPPTVPTASVPPPTPPTPPAPPAAPSASSEVNHG